MSESTSSSPDTPKEATPPGPEPGPVSQRLRRQGFDHQVLEPDHLGVETIAVEPLALEPVAAALKAFGFDYLQCQGAYDEGAGRRLVSFYHLVKMGGFTRGDCGVEEVRLKVFHDRSTPVAPSLYGLYRGADWQERESFDMFGISYEGHPHPKRLLMPEDWQGWPLRKDYVQPDFYEMQDAY
ncbi:MAG: NAD(P)H-quinone oxidoreductase subunit J [Synechococcus sp. SB0677_bin_5]|nr:NAD(P)H-quinone oxidoreductase subunit J [Synechococcus sp. SB0677_bin_5]